MLFISHSTSDDDNVNELAAALETAGFATWIDHRKGIEPGTPSWDKAIRDAIRASTAGILVMSPRALKSDICGAECLLVRELDKPLYVVRLEHCDPADVWLYIKLIQYADVGANFNAGVNALIEALNGKTGAGIPVPVRARERAAIRCACICRICKTRCAGVTPIWSWFAVRSAPVSCRSSDPAGWASHAQVRVC